MAVPVIQLIDLRKNYPMGETEVQALRGITLEVHKGEFVAIVGPSGSGKSTLMNIIGCLDRPTSGKYFLDGKDVSIMSGDQRAEIRNAKIGFVFQNFNLLPRTTALENVELPLLYSKNHRLSDRERENLAKRCLSRVGLSGREHHTSSQLSGGQQQRVAIARALVNDPAILLADEPTGNLDSATSEDIMKLFDDLHGEGKTIVLITHEVEIARHAARVITVRDGRILSDTKKL